MRKIKLTMGAIEMLLGIMIALVITILFDFMARYRAGYSMTTVLNTPEYLLFGIMLVVTGFLAIRYWNRLKDESKMEDKRDKQMEKMLDLLEKISKNQRRNL